MHHVPLLSSVLLALITLDAQAAPTVHVLVAAHSDARLRFTVTESREFVHGRAAIRRYEFFTPRRRSVDASDIRHFYARYDGPDGVWQTRRSPVGGHILLDHPRRPLYVEFRLQEERDRGHITPMTINGRHHVHTKRSNHAMERTTDRCAFHFEMTSTASLRATRALARCRSSYSR